LRVHPSWSRFVEIGRTLGKPLVIRMNLNQQSAGPFWEVHKKLMQSTSPIVDCGVHYVDIMCQVTGARPTAVHAVGARLSSEIAPTNVQLRPSSHHVRRRIGWLGTRPGGGR